MSVFCPKCSKRTYDEYICDLCSYEIKKDTISHKNSKSIHISNSIKNKNWIIMMVMLAIITVSLSYIAYNKFRERSENEKAFKYVTGYDNVDDYLKSDRKKTNSQFIKDAEKEMQNASESKIKLFNDMLGQVTDSK